MNRTVARPYAKAAFEYAQSTQALDAWASALSVFKVVFEGPEIYRWISSPYFKVADLDGVVSLLQNLPEGFRQFLLLLGQRQRLACLPEIVQIFEELSRESLQLKSVTVTAAQEWTPESQQVTSKDLKGRFGDHLKIEWEVNPDLIGGLVVRSGDRVFDASLRTLLSGLSKELKQ